MIEVPGGDHDSGWARWYNQQPSGAAAFEVSQRKCKLNEEIFGWLKVLGGVRRARVVG